VLLCNSDGALKELLISAELDAEYASDDEYGRKELVAPPPADIEVSPPTELAAEATDTSEEDEVARKEVLVSDPTNIVAEVAIEAATTEDEGTR